MVLVGADREERPVWTVTEERDVLLRRETEGGLFEGKGGAKETAKLGVSGGGQGRPRERSL